ncbi:hypothetical protein [uncultured Abyssibacter sp.]|uniref:hypothetical protein n=1 Tax=uncultured Abyssibacter sp. TaxID=2320202 RepID=UPI0032B28DD0
MFEEDRKSAIKEYGGVLPMHYAFYIEAIRPHCLSAMRSIEYLADYIQMTNQTKGDFDQAVELSRAVLDNLENLVINAAAIRRYFWPVREGKHNLHSERGKALREKFRIGDDSPLKDKRLRDFLEHFDEKLDAYLWSKPITGHVIPYYVGGFPKSGGVPLHVFRAYYIDVGVFESLGTRYEIQPIADEVMNIAQVLEAS